MKNRMEPTTRAAVIQALSERIMSYYVFPEVAEKVCTHLEHKLAEGAFDDLSEGKLFALGVTIEMQEVSRDEHLWLKWHPEPLPEVEEGLREDPAWQKRKREEAALGNYGFRKVERLEGNVGYLDIRYFHRTEWGGHKAALAMGFLAGANALIFDLRECSGGYPDMVALISSYLFGVEPVHFDSIYWRDEEATLQFWTLPYVPGSRFMTEPAYVLVCRSTFSAGEAFAYNLQAQGRVTVIGEETGGGANPGPSYRVGSHFEAFIPVGRSINPVTNENWEGRGVIPDIQLTGELALNGAYAMSLREIVSDEGSISQVLVEEAEKTLEVLSEG